MAIGSSSLSSPSIGASYYGGGVRGLSPASMNPISLASETPAPERLGSEPQESKKKTTEGTRALQFIKLVVGTLSGAYGSRSTAQSGFLKALGIQFGFNLVETALITSLMAGNNPVSNKMLGWAHAITSRDGKSIDQMSTEDRDRALPFVTMAITVVAGQLQTLFNFIDGNKKRQALVNSTTRPKINFQFIKENLWDPIYNWSLKPNMAELPALGKKMLQYVDDFVVHNPVTQFAQKRPWTMFLFSLINCALIGYLQGFAAQKAGQMSRKMSGHAPASGPPLPALPPQTANLGSARPLIQDLRFAQALQAQVLQEGNQPSIFAGFVVK